MGVLKLPVALYPKAFAATECRSVGQIWYGRPHASGPHAFRSTRPTTQSQRSKGPVCLGSLTEPRCLHMANFSLAWTGPRLASLPTMNPVRTSLSTAHAVSFHRLVSPSGLSISHFIGRHLDPSFYGLSLPLHTLPRCPSSSLLLEYLNIRQLLRLRGGSHQIVSNQTVQEHNHT